MKAIIVEEFGSADQLKFKDVPTPKPKSNEILVKIHATALNRADIAQREGRYPPPKGESEILGLEMAGEIIQLGEAVSDWKIGDKVCGLLAGGGYAEYVCIHEKMALPIPKHFSFEKAAAIPEAFLTAYQALFLLAKLQPNEKILIHAGASGVGTAAIQLAKLINADIFITASQPKHILCQELGANHTIDYKNENFETYIRENSNDINVIIDFIAAPYFQKNINSLAIDGRLVILALMGGVNVADFKMARVLSRRLQIMGSTLRNRTLDYKINLTQKFKELAWQRFETGELKPVIDTVFDWNDVKLAHEYMEANKNQGKIVLKII